MESPLMTIFPPCIPDPIPLSFYRNFSGIAEGEDESSCHVLSQERSEFSPNDKNRELVAVLFHMDTSTVSDIVPDKDLSSTHRVGNGIPRTPMDDYSAIFHRVTRCVIAVAEDDASRTSHEHAEISSGDTIDHDRHVTFTPSAMNLCPRTLVMTISSAPDSIASRILG